MGANVITQYTEIFKLCCQKLEGANVKLCHFMNWAEVSYGPKYKAQNSYLVSFFLFFFARAKNQRSSRRQYCNQ